MKLKQSLQNGLVMKSKVYLAKSNRSNPDDVSRVRTLLSKFDVEIVEFKGGAYSHKPLLECEYLIVVPDLSERNDEYVEDDDYVPLGKGLHEQIEAFNDVNNECDTLIVTWTDKYDILVSGFLEFDVCNTDDYVNYSYCYLNNEGGPLSSILASRLGHPTGNQTYSTSKKTTNNYLLLG